MGRTFWQRFSLISLFLWAFRITVVLVVVVGTYGTLSSGKYGPAQWIDIVIFGLSQGSIYALIALGYTMVYGILRMINFAHGEVFMSGAYTAYFAAAALNGFGFLARHPFLGLLIVLVVAMATATGVGLLVERIAYRPLRRAPRLVPLIAAIGASFFLQYTFRGFFGAVFLMVALYLFVMRTKIGTAMRAVSEDMEVAAMMGINVDRVIVVTFGVGAAAAGAAGVLYALVFKQVWFFMGFVPGIKAFTSAVLGGIGNIPGAMVGGLFLGLIESAGPILFLDGLGIPAPNQLKDVFAFTMLVLVLIFRPTGILGERLAAKKA